MAIIINIDVMLAKKEDERHRAFGEGRHYDGQSFYSKKRQSKGDSTINFKFNLRSLGLPTGRHLGV